MVKSIFQKSGLTGKSHSSERPSSIGRNKCFDRPSQQELEKQKIQNPKGGPHGLIVFSSKWETDWIVLYEGSWPFAVDFEVRQAQERRVPDLFVFILLHHEVWVYFLFESAQIESWRHLNRTDAPWHKKRPALTNSLNYSRPFCEAFYEPNSFTRFQNRTWSRMLLSRMHLTPKFSSCTVWKMD